MGLVFSNGREVARIADNRLKDKFRISFTAICSKRLKISGLDGLSPDCPAGWLYWWGKLTVPVAFN